MHIKFPAGTIIHIRGAEHIPQGYQNGDLLIINRITGKPYVHERDDGTVGLMTREEFDRLLDSGDLEIRGPRTTDAVRLRNETSEWTIAQASKLDPAVEKMLVQCQMLDDAGIPNSDKAIGRYFDKKWTKELQEKFGDHDPARTVRSWRSTRGRPGHRHARDMVRLNRVKGVRRSVDNVNRQVMWKHAIEGWTVKAAVKDVHAAYAAEIEQINEGRHPIIPRPDKPYSRMSERTIRRAYNELESSATTGAKFGRNAVEQDWAGAGRTLTADFAFHRVIIDHTRLNAFAVDDEFEMVLGRPWLSLAIDVKTRAIVGWLITFIDPCTWTVGEIVRRMAMPKRPPHAMAERYPVLRFMRGKAAEIVVDNAAEFRSFMFEAAARSAGFGIRFCPIKSPRYRAVGERAMGTINREICRLMPGSTLSPHDARRFEHDPEAEALALLVEIEAVANMAIAIYNTEPHDGLGGRQPALVMEQELNRNGIMNFADLASFRIDTMKIVEDAQLTPSGLRAFGLRYHDIVAVRALLDDLVPLEGRRKRRDDATATVDFRYDPMDIGRIHVWNRRTRKYVELVCSDECYADGMPFWFHEQIQKAAKAEGARFNTQEERLSARNRLVQAIRNIAPNAKAKVRAKVAKLLEIPRIRQITGNIVELAESEAVPVELSEFISCDRAAETSLDHEILSTRPNRDGKKRTALKLRRDRRDASRAAVAATPPDDPTRATARRARPGADRGGYK